MGYAMRVFLNEAIAAARSFPPVRPMFLGNVSEELGEVRMGEGSELF